VVKIRNDASPRSADRTGGGLVGHEIKLHMDDITLLISGNKMNKVVTLFCQKLYEYRRFGAGILIV
jgi:hypothetical protein